MTCYLYDLFQLYLMASPDLEVWLIASDQIGTLTSEGVMQTWQLVDGEVCDTELGHKAENWPE